MSPDKLMAECVAIITILLLNKGSEFDGWLHVIMLCSWARHLALTEPLTCKQEVQTELLALTGSDKY